MEQESNLEPVGQEAAHSPRSMCVINEMERTTEAILELRGMVLIRVAKHPMKNSTMS
jgi:hypothetical protein